MQSTPDPQQQPLAVSLSLLAPKLFVKPDPLDNVRCVDSRVACRD